MVALTGCLAGIRTLLKYGVLFQPSACLRVHLMMFTLLGGYEREAHRTRQEQLALIPKPFLAKIRFNTRSYSGKPCPFGWMDVWLPVFPNLGQKLQQYQKWFGQTISIWVGGCLILRVSNQGREKIPHCADVLVCVILNLLKTTPTPIKNGSYGMKVGFVCRKSLSS